MKIFVQERLKWAVWTFLRLIFLRLHCTRTRNITFLECPVISTPFLSWMRSLSLSWTTNWESNSLLFLFPSYLFCFTFHTAARSFPLSWISQSFKRCIISGAILHEISCCRSSTPLSSVSFSTSTFITVNTDFVILFFTCMCILEMGEIYFWHHNISTIRNI